MNEARAIWLRTTRTRNTYVPEDEIDLRHLWQVIVKYKGTILTVLGVILFTTLIATLLMRPVYRSTALLEIKPDRGSVVKFQNFDEGERQPREYKTTQKNILTSDSVAAAVILKLNLLANPEMSGTQTQRGFLSGVMQILAVFTNREDVSGEDNSPFSGVDPDYIKKEQAVKRFKGRLTISQIRNSDLFEVSFDSFRPATSAKVANSVVDEYMRLNQERRFDSTSDAKAFLELEIEKIQAKLEASEKDLTEFARRHQIIDVEDRGNIMTERLSDLSTELTKVNAERMAAEAMYTQISIYQWYRSATGDLGQFVDTTIKTGLFGIPGPIFQIVENLQTSISQATANQGGDGSSQGSAG